MDVEYIKKIQEWIQLDNRTIDIKNTIKTLQTDNKDIFDKRDEVEKEIVEYIENNKMDMITINTNDGNIKFSKRNTTQPLSLKLFRSVLENYKKECPLVDTDDIYKYVVSNMESKTKISIKRTLHFDD